MSQVDFSPAVSFPYHLGLFLCVNAIQDAYLMVDGPACSLSKAEFIQGSHDLYSTLLRLEGGHRLRVSLTCADDMARDRSAAFAERLKKACAAPECGAALVTCLPVCGVAGMDYPEIIRQVLPGKDVFYVPDRSLSGDWLEGFADALSALAAGIRLEVPARRRRRAAVVVGYPMDRNEQDHLANLAEVRRLAALAGLDVVSFWPSGGTTAELKACAAARLVVSLPHGRRAARILAERLGAELVECPLPFGLAPTCEFVRKLAGAGGADRRQVETALRDEARPCAARLERLVPEVFCGTRFAFIGDPLFMPGAVSMSAELGMEAVCWVSTAAAPGSELPAGTLVSPPAGRLGSILSGWKGGGGPELVVSCDLSIFGLRIPPPAVEFGFPSYRTHWVSPAPSLGFSGYLHFMNRLFNAILARDGDLIRVVS